MSILGTSRTRTLHYDMLGMLGFRGMFNHTKEGIRATLGWTRAKTGTRMDFYSHHYKVGFSILLVARVQCMGMGMGLHQSYNKAGGMHSPRMVLSHPPS